MMTEHKERGSEGYLFSCLKYLWMTIRSDLACSALKISDGDPLFAKWASRAMAVACIYGYPIFNTVVATSYFFYRHALLTMICGINAPHETAVDTSESNLEIQIVQIKVTRINWRK